MMTKKITVKGVDLEYDPPTWNGKHWTQADLDALHKESMRKLQEKRRKELEAEQAKQDAREQERAEYQASLDAPSKYPPLPEPAGDGQAIFDKALVVLFVGAVLLVLLLR